MLKKIIAILIIIVLTSSITACSIKKKRYEAEFLVLFNTLTKIVAYTNDKSEFTKYTQLIYDNLKEMHELYDIYNDYPGRNNIKTINDNAGIKPVKVDKRIIDLLVFAKNSCKSTNGRMNIAFGAVTKIWHDYRERALNDETAATLPTIDELQVAAKHTDIDKIIIDVKESTVFLNDSQMSLDVGAVAKGYAVEQAARIAIRNGFTSGLISVGGNVRAIGYKGSNREFWNLGIQNPNSESENTNLEIVYLSDMSLVSSGDYERYYTVEGKRYHHIIDPDTLFPAGYFTDVTIICKDSGVADVLSTAVFNMPFEKGLAYINSLRDTEALWVMKNGEIRYSHGFKAYMNKNR